MNSKQTEEQQSLDEKIKGIVVEIFYAPATNDKSLESISNGIRKVKELLAEHTALPSKPVGDVEEMAKEYAKTDCYDDPVVDGKMTNYPYIDKEKKKHFTNGFKSGYAAAPQKGMKWVKASKSPMKNGYYICWLGNEQGLIHYHSDTGWQNGFYNDKVTHYMPLIPPDESPSPSEAGDAAPQKGMEGWIDASIRLPELDDEEAMELDGDFSFRKYVARFEENVINGFERAGLYTAKELREIKHDGYWEWLDESPSDSETGDGWISVSSLKKLITNMKDKNFLESVIIEEVERNLDTPERLHKVFPPSNP